MREQDLWKELSSERPRLRSSNAPSAVRSFHERHRIASGRTGVESPPSTSRQSIRYRPFRFLPDLNDLSLFALDARPQGRASSKSRRYLRAASGNGTGERRGRRHSSLGLATWSWPSISKSRPEPSGSPGAERRVMQASIPHGAAVHSFAWRRAHGPSSPAPKKGLALSNGRAGDLLTVRKALYD